MSKKKLLTIPVVLAAGLHMHALTLEESIVEILNTNPIIQERLRNYRATQQDLNIAKSEYYPKVDLRGVAGYNNAGKINNKIKDYEYINYESSLILTQNIFNGFGTKYKVDYQNARILAAAHHYIEKANDTALDMTNAYLNVLRTQELLETASKNVEINTDIYNKVTALYNSGLTTHSEVKKIQSSLSLAKSNYTVEQNNFRDAKFSFRRVLGRMPIVSSMTLPALNVQLPSSIDEAAKYAVEHNPSILVSDYNIKGAQALNKQRKKEFYPSLDLEVSQHFNDVEKIYNGFDQLDDRFRARLILNYNLFHGGADSANVQKHITKINQEVDTQRELKRQVIEDLDLSWSAYEMLGKQIVELQKYLQYSEKTLELYKQEYNMGRRTLLDLLSAQNDLINAKRQKTIAKYDLLFAKYRILDAMGTMVETIVSNSDEYKAKVNLSDKHSYKVVNEKINLKLEEDKDNVKDRVDLCDNSVLGDYTQPYGCIKRVEKDENSKKQVIKPITKKAVIKSSEINEPLPTKDNPVVKNLMLNFKTNSAKILKSSYHKVKEFASFLKEYPKYKAAIYGHTDSIGSEKYNLKLSTARANSVKNALIKEGIEASRLEAHGSGEFEPIQSNATEAGRKANRRIEAKLYY